ncbi:MAG: hypothetical protein IJ688_14035 [Treponema sp.]|nr:hypothetical protein [Treponema sp.]
MKFFSKGSFVFFALILLSLSIYSGCTKNDDDIIEFDKTYPLALAPDVEWGVVTEPYVGYKKDSDWTSPVTGHCRKGEIIQVLGKRQDESGEKWYYTEKGWLSEISVNIYSNRYKAQKVANELLSK